MTPCYVLYKHSLGYEVLHYDGSPDPARNIIASTPRREAALAALRLLGIEEVYDFTGRRGWEAGPVAVATLKRSA